MDPVKVDILDKQYLVACPKEEKPALLRSASYLDQKMREIRDTGKVVGVERIAVMAALNIAHELLQGRAESEALEDVRRKLEALEGRLNAAVEV